MNRHIHTRHPSAWHGLTDWTRPGYDSVEKSWLQNVLSVVHANMTDQKRLPARFFKSDSGKIPVREWLLALPQYDRKVIDDDIRTAEFGWPIGMSLYRSI